MHLSISLQILFNLLWLLNSILNTFSSYSSRSVLWNRCNTLVKSIFTLFYTNMGKHSFCKNFRFSVFSEFRDVNSVIWLILENVCDKNFVASITQKLMHKISWNFTLFHSKIIDVCNIFMKFTQKMLLLFCFFQNCFLQHGISQNFV